MICSRRFPLCNTMTACYRHAGIIPSFFLLTILGNGYKLFRTWLLSMFPASKEMPLHVPQFFSGWIPPSGDTFILFPIQGHSNFDLPSITLNDSPPLFPCPAHR